MIMENSAVMGEAIRLSTKESRKAFRPLYLNMYWKCFRVRE